MALIVSADLGLAQVMTRRNILEEGTFASIVGNHIVNMPGDGFDDDDDDEAGCQVVVCATEAPTGHWLRSKLNVARADTHVAAFHGLARDGVVSLLDWAEVCRVSFMADHS